MKLMIGIALVLVCFVFFLAYWTHKDDARLEAECKARGGKFVHAREPLHVCVKEI